MEAFSGGYYRLEMGIQPFAEGPAIERGLLDFIEREFYYQTDAPVTMRLGLDRGVTFHPDGVNGMPTDALAIPEPMCDTVGIHPSAESVSVFIVKPAHAYLFSQTEKLGPDWLNNHNISDIALSEEKTEYFNVENNDE